MFCLCEVLHTSNLAAELVERVVILGAPISINNENWRDVRKVKLNSVLRSLPNIHRIESLLMRFDTIMRSYLVDGSWKIHQCICNK